MKVIHYSVYNRNIGDNALNWYIDETFKDKFDYYEVYNLFDGTDNKTFTRKDVDYMNTFDIVIIGGGGLLHPIYKDKKNNKDLEYPTVLRISNDLLEKINTHIVLYGWGYDNTKREPPLPKETKKFLKICRKKGWHIFFRNDNTLKRLKNELGGPECKSFFEIPDPGLFFEIPKVKKINNRIGINITLDKIKNRFNSRREVIKFIKWLDNFIKNKGYEPIYIPHTNPDLKLKNFHPDLNFLPLKNDFNLTKEAWQEYRKCDRVITMRGHGLIVNTANLIPTFAISTHPKVRGFSDSNGLERFYWDKFSQDFQELEKKLNHFLNRDWDEIFYDQVKELKKQWLKDINEFNNWIIHYKDLKEVNYFSLYEELYKKGYHNKGNIGVVHADNIVNNYDFNSILDIGCSYGDAVEYYQEKGKDSYGIDVALTPIKKCRKKGLKCITASVLNIPFKNDNFDVVVTSDVLEHLDYSDLNRAIKEITRVSKKYIFITVENNFESNEKNRNILRQIKEENKEFNLVHNLHLSVYIDDEWVSMFKKYKGIEFIKKDKNLLIFEKRKEC